MSQQFMRSKEGTETPKKAHQMAGVMKETYMFDSSVTQKAIHDSA